MVGVKLDVNDGYIFNEGYSKCLGHTPLWFGENAPKMTENEPHYVIQKRRRRGTKDPPLIIDMKINF